MSIHHHIQCDAKLPDGQRCEIKAPCPNPHQVPIDWATVQLLRKSTVEDSKIYMGMKPMLDLAKARALKEGPDSENEIYEASKAMMAGMVESQYPVAVQAHLCPEHSAELPKFEASETNAPYCV